MLQNSGHHTHKTQLAAEQEKDEKIFRNLNCGL